MRQGGVTVVANQFDVALDAAFAPPKPKRRVKPNPGAIRTAYMVKALFGNDPEAKRADAAASVHLAEAIAEHCVRWGYGATAAILAQHADHLAALDAGRRRPGPKRGTSRTGWPLETAVKAFLELREQPNAPSDNRILDELIEVMRMRGVLPTMTTPESVKRAIRRRALKPKGLLGLVPKRAGQK